MNSQTNQLPPRHRAILERFVLACQADEGVVAAFLSGSYARGKADAYSDLDLGLLTTDAAYEDFAARRGAFIRRLGEPLFLEDFDIPNMVFFFIENGVEGELAFAPESQLDQLHSGPSSVLLDKRGLFPGAMFTPHTSPSAGQVETLRRQVFWFWHDLSHFITALGRGQLWWAYGQLEVLRRYCVSLARLRQDFSADAGSDEPYFKLEKALPVEQLAPLQATFCTQEPRAMLQSARQLLRFYQELAPALAQAHGLAYPEGLERLMVVRLEKVADKLP